MAKLMSYRKSSQSTDELGRAPVGKLMVKLAIPAILAQLINMLYNIVDRIYIGRMPNVGALALTGLGVCGPIIIIVSAFAALVAMGAAPRASIEMGKGNQEEAERILGASFMLQVVLSVILTTVLLIWGEPLLMLFGASEHTIGYALDYLRIYALGTVFVQLTLGMNAFVTAQGFARLSMMTVLIGAITNIVLDPIFIFVFDMGVAGAAWATIISQAISCLWVVYFIAGKRTNIRLQKKHMRLDVQVLLPCMALGLSPFVMQSSESVLAIVFNTSLQRHGGDLAVGAMTICTTVMQFAMMPLQGLAQGAQPISSYSYGAGNAGRVKKTFRYLVTSSLVYAGLLWALVQLFPQAVAGIFTSNQALAAFTAGKLRIYTAALFLMGIQVACQMTFISIDNAKSSIIVAVFRKFVFLIPLILILPNFFADKTMAVFLAEPVADTVAVLFTVFMFSREFSRAMKALKSPPLQEITAV